MKKYEKVITYMIGTLAVILFLALIVGINLFRAGGDWGCVFTQEPQICVAIKGTR